MQNVASLSDTLLVSNGEAYTTTFNDGNLFMWMIVRWRIDVRGKAQPANHQLFTDNHLSLNAFAQTFNRYILPVPVLCSVARIGNLFHHNSPPCSSCFQP